MRTGGYKKNTHGSKDLHESEMIEEEIPECSKHVRVISQLLCDVDACERIQEYQINYLNYKQ